MKVFLFKIELLKLFDLMCGSIRLVYIVYISLPYRDRLEALILLSLYYRRRLQDPEGHRQAGI